MMRTVIDRVARGVALASIIGWVTLTMLILGSVSNLERADAAAAARTETATAPATTPELEQRRDTPQTSLEEVAPTVMCPSCDSTLDQSNSPAADRMRAWVAAAVAAGWTEEEIRDGLVEEYGGDESILATPRAHGLGLAAWLMPALLAFGAIAAGFVMLRRWRRSASEHADTAQTGSASASSSYSHASSPASPSASASSPPPSPSDSAR